MTRQPTSRSGDRTGPPAAGVLNFSGELTAEQMSELENRWTAIVTSPQRYRYKYLCKGRWRHALPLPWNTRLRLWCTGRTDAAAIWLCDRGRPGAAESLWRLTGAWRRRAWRRKSGASRTA